MTFIPVAEWGGPGTPFQLAGKSPITRTPAAGRRSPADWLWGCAHGHLGFYGYLRVADARIMRRVGLGLMDLPDRLWRDSYVERVHPAEAADEAIAEEAEDMGIEL